ncbi:unnamed protein product [Phytophthora fragariaefolia]|uniref:IMP-specific 5'-nucleotidase 1 n=1 Tax=Phytophthora fragariaefolia TaxID=1490495 RepID=A0A9W7D520_9STRA|nr:unnamed protein product [Phytophthora fragariaefolia]
MRDSEELCNIQGQECLHVGDRFTTTGNDTRSRDAATTIWISNPQETVHIMTTLLQTIDRVREQKKERREEREREKKEKIEKRVKALAAVPTVPSDDGSDITADTSDGESSGSSDEREPTVTGLIQVATTATLLLSCSLLFCNHQHIMLSDKQFLLWSLPLALVAFLAGPLAVLHSFDLIAPVPVTTLTPQNPTSDFKLSANGSTTHPDTIPLMFEVAKYPAIGHQTLEVQDLRLLNLTSFAAMVSRSTDEMAPAVIGYMSITEVLRQKRRNPRSYPVGDLLLVTDVSFTGFDDEAGERESLILETQRAQRFRLKNVQYDESTGLLFGQVEWAEKQLL